MYSPSHFTEERVEVLVAAMRDIQFGTFITQAENGLEISHVPTFVHHRDEQDKIIIEAHVARANPHWKALNDQHTTVIFLGPQAYVSPSWLPSKQVDEKVVPTWSYVVVHARGHLEAVTDPNWMLRHLNDLTRQNEARMEDPWEVSDAPEKFTAALMRGIVGFRLTVEHLEGTWKINQNMPEADRRGAARGLAESSEAGGQLAAALRDDFA